MSNALNLRGFVEIEDLINSTPGVVSELGELSALSRTFSTTISEVSSNSPSGYTLVNFNCVDTVAGGQVAPYSSITSLIFTAANQCIAYTGANLLPFNTQNFINAMYVALNNQVTNLQIGNFITQTSALTIPEWISFNDTATGSTIRFWMCDASFRAQYDLTQIIIVPPITPIDNFFQTIGIVQGEIAAATPVTLINNIRAAKGNNPETDIMSFTFNYISPIIGNAPIPTTWSAIIYGSAGDNETAVKNAFQQYILANTQKTVADWQVIFPDIYLQTEFVLLPRWDLVAIPQTTVATGIYSTITNAQADITFATSMAPFYTSGFVQQNTQTLTHYYKYVSIIVINGQNNAPAYATIKNVIPDYIPESSSSLDFNRMTPTTQNWSNIIEQMLMIAETMTSVSSLPSGFIRVYRNGIMYLATTIDNIDYLMGVGSTYPV